MTAAEELEMDELGFAPADLVEAESYSVLGPAYFAGRRIAEAATTHLTPEALRPIVKKAADDLYEQLLNAVEASIMFDTESNVQGSIRRMVDQTVQAILDGKAWALERYPFANDHDGKAIREAIFAQCGDRLESARIADLEADVARLTQSLEWRR